MATAKPRPVVAHGRKLAKLLLATLMLAGAPLGCAKEKLTEIAVPAEGVELRYDLQPGATFEGKVQRHENLSLRGQTMTRSISFTVQLVVTAIDEQGNARVAATIGNIDPNWVVPGLPVSMNEFNNQAKALLNGVKVPFSVEPGGAVFDVPPPPPELDGPTAEVLNSIIEALTSAFFVVPEERLTAGKSWEHTDTRGREGKLGKYTEDVVRGTLVGMFEDPETGQKLAKIGIDGDKTETTTTKDGSSEIRTRSDTTLYWDTEASYMTKISSAMTRTQGADTTRVSYSVTWTRSIAGKTSSDTPAPAGVEEKQQVQSIDDPCDDDYVGPNECLDPCNVNYLGEEPCEEGGEAADGGEAAEGEAAEGGEAATDE